MSGYTPSEEEVRASVGSGWSAPYRDALKARFDRFLAEDRRKTAARALRRFVENREDILKAVEMFEERGADVVDLIVQHALMEADRIERGASDDQS